MKELIGLVVCGGLSMRMGMDKSLIEWHGIEQRYYLYRMLETLCKKVYISCNNSQSDQIAPGYSYIIDDDKYFNTGPIAALLTAFGEFPGKSFLVVGCDYPFIVEKDLLQLVSNRNEDRNAISFFNKRSGFYEPLLSIYENKIAGSLFENFDKQQHSLQVILVGSGAKKVTPSNLRSIQSIDTRHEYLNAIEELRIK